MHASPVTVMPPFSSDGQQLAMTSCPVVVCSGPFPPRQPALPTEAWGDVLSSMRDMNLCDLLFNKSQANISYFLYLIQSCTMSFVRRSMYAPLTHQLVASRQSSRYRGIWRHLATMSGNLVTRFT